MTSLFSDILDTVKTKSEKDELLSEIDQMQTSLFKTVPLRDALKAIVRLKTLDLVERILRSENKTFSDIDALQSLLEGIKQELNALKTITITIAFEPTEETLDMVSHWAEKALLEKVLLEIVTDKKILGGAIIIFEGLYKDMSLLTKVEKVFKDEKEQITKLIS